MTTALVLPLSFALVALAAHRVGRWATAIRLPYITGYLAAGALAGSFGLGLIATESAVDLRWIDEVSLAVIAFVAGSELHLPDIKPMFRTVRRIAGAVVGIGMLLLVPVVWVVAGLVDTGATLGSEGRIAVALLGAIVLLALSPPSTIAVIREARANGRFTSTILSVTILMDVVVVVLFAAGTSIVAALLHDVGIDLVFVAVLAVDLVIAAAIGVALGHGLGRAAGHGATNVFVIATVLFSGWAVHEGAALLDSWSTASLPVELHLEPLLVCMVAGFTVTNRTGHREAFDRLLRHISPAVYVAFFTLTGLGLKLDILLDVLPAAAALFLVRLLALRAGTQVATAGRADESALRRSSWMALVTQAGIALGLAREATVQFPELGASFATLIIAVVVLNEVFGPLFLRRALDRVGEAHAPTDTGTVLLYGIDRRMVGLADRLTGDGWEVILADANVSMVADLLDRGRRALHLDGDLTAIHATLLDADLTVDVAVVGDADDQRNLAVARAIVGRNPRVRLVARVNGPEGAGAFDELDALVIDHTSAVTALLEQAIRTPAAVALVFPSEEGRQTRQLTIPAGWHERELRELRLPEDVLVLEVRHGAATMVPDGFTPLRRGDTITLLGPAGALDETRARLLVESGGRSKGSADVTVTDGETRPWQRLGAGT